MSVDTTVKLTQSKLQSSLLQKEAIRKAIGGGSLAKKESVLEHFKHFVVPAVWGLVENSVCEGSSIYLND